MKIIHLRSSFFVNQALNHKTVPKASLKFFFLSFPCSKDFILVGKCNLCLENFLKSDVERMFKEFPRFGSNFKVF